MAEITHDVTSLQYDELEQGNAPRYGLTTSSEAWPKCAAKTFAWFVRFTDALEAQPSFGDVRVIDLERGMLV